MHSSNKTYKTLFLPKGIVCVEIFLLLVASFFLEKPFVSQDGGVFYRRHKIEDAYMRVSSYSFEVNLYGVFLVKIFLV